MCDVSLCTGPETDYAAAMVYVVTRHSLQFVHLLLLVPIDGLVFRLAIKPLVQSNRFLIQSRNCSEGETENSNIEKKETSL